MSAISATGQARLMLQLQMKCLIVSLKLRKSTKAKYKPPTSNTITIKSSFKEVMKSSAFVDHSKLIQVFVENGNHVSLITCPRRFGKSSNINMIKEFLSCQVDENGKMITTYKNRTNNYKLFFSNLSNGERLNITKDPDFVKGHLAEYPVIFVDFFNARGKTNEEIIQGIKSEISLAYKQHKYISVFYENILLSPKSTQYEKSNATEVLNEFNLFFKNNGNDANNRDIMISLRALTMILFNHFGKKVFVLIDEYDAPLSSAIQNENENDVKTIIEFMDMILSSVFKANESFLEKGLMTGISGIVRAAGNSPLNNIIEYKFLSDHEYTQFYGFSEAQVEGLLSKFGKTEEEKSQVKLWYNGYMTRVKHLPIYCPWPILRYLNSNQLMNYWTISGSIKKMSEIFKVGGIRTNIEKLIEGQDIFITKFKNDIKPEDVKGLKELLNCKSELPQHYIDIFFSYLFELGYLTCTVVENKYRIPNKEVRIMFEEQLIEYFVSVYKVKREDKDEGIKELNKLLTGYTDDNGLGFEKALQNIFSSLKFNNMINNEAGLHLNEHLVHSIVSVLVI
jgi:hypothetical protein